MKNHVCHLCTSKPTLNFDFSMAFQPIVDLTDKSILSYEALVRGSNNEPAASVFARINNINIYRFDQLCRMKAIELAAKHKLKTRLSINFMPGAVYSPARCLRSTLETASRFDFPIERICFEVVESRKVQNLDYLQDIINTYQNLGFSTIFDDFGTGFASYEWLAVLNPDAIKIDMSVVRDVDKQKKKQIILQYLYSLSRDLGIDIIAEGVETIAERDCLIQLGIMKQQGFLFGKPAFESFAGIAPLSIV